MLRSAPIHADPRRLVAGLSTLALLAAALVAGVAPAKAVSANLVVSQVYGGGGNSGATLTNDYIEVFNRGSVAVSTGGMSVQYAASAGSFNAATPLPSATLQPGQYLLVQESAGTGGTQPLPTPDATGSITMSATSGKVALATGTTTLGCGATGTTPAPCSETQTARIVDLVGFGTAATMFEGSGPTASLTNTTAALRAGAGCTDTDDNASDFTTGIPAPRNTSTTLAPCGTGDSAPSVTTTAPADGATGVALTANVSVTFSEPVDVSGSWFTLSCDASGSHTATVTGGPTTYTLDPDSDLVYGDDCTLTVTAGLVSDQDANDPPDTMVMDKTITFAAESTDPCDVGYTPVYELQGAGTATPFQGQSKTTEGVVVGDTQGSAGLNGFFVQDVTGDGDPATSDGIFVFVPSASPFFGLDVEVGDVVHLTGRVTEFNTLTEVDNVSALKTCGTADVPAPTQVELPEAVDGDLEQVEGMYAAVSGPDGDPLTVEQNFFLGRYGQLTLGAGGRLFQPTNEFPADDPGAGALADLNKRSMIVLDDGSGRQNPDPVPYLGADNVRRAGDQVSELVGVIDYGQINSNAAIRDYRIHPTEAPSFENTNPRPAAPEEVGGTVKVAAVNVLNYFNTFTGCTFGVGGAPTDCRGANNSTEFERQQTKIVNEISALDADVVGLMEIENDGYGPTSAVQSLVDALNAKVGAGTYSFVDVDTATGQVNAAGTDAIRVAMLYRGSRVERVGQTAVLNTGAFGQYTLQDGSTIGRHRPAIAQAFQDTESGERVVVSVNHFKSKGSGCADNVSPVGPDPDTGDGQGNCNLTRVAAAEELTEWLAGDPTASGDEDALIVGDLNSYAKEDPVLAIEGAGYTDLIEHFVGGNGYSYVFDGMSGYLDHALGTDSLVDQVSDVTEWHTNADEPSVLDYNTEFKTAGQVTGLYSPLPYRASDHDPVLVGLDLGRCTFTDDLVSKVRHLDGDCSTSETVLVPDGWTLDGDGHTISAYDPVGGHFVGAVVKNEGASANVRELTVTAHDLADVCDDGDARLRGILLDGAAGTIRDNEVVGIRQAGSGCQEGNAIEVRNAPFGTAGPDKAVTVRDNVVDDYQKTGILVNGSVNATVAGNDVSGLGPVPYIAQNGVQIGFGASATVDGNRLADNWYTGTADAISCGLLLYQADGVKQKRNVFVANQQDLCNFGRGGGSPAS